MKRLTSREIIPFFPSRGHDAYKFTNGFAYACVGSATYPGAAALVAKAVMAIGAGGVFVESKSDRVGNVVLSHLPEAIVLTNQSEFKASFRSKSRAFLIGSGVPQSDMSDHDFQEIIHEKKPVVIDAGAIEKLATLKSFGNLSNLIMTPNFEEAKRFTGCESIQEIIQKLSEFSKTTGCTVFFKKAEPIIFIAGEPYMLEPINAAATTAGCGDVLAGLMVGLLAQQLKPVYAAALASSFSAEAVKLYLKAEGAHTILASDIIRFVPRVLAAYAQHRTE